LVLPPTQCQHLRKNFQMQPGDLHMEPITANDDDSIARLAQENNGNENLGKDFINWWYRKNPVGFFTFVKLMRGEAAEGYATTNNFLFSIGNEKRKVAMPQNVLTSAKVRGGGFFGKLYWETERLNKENGYDTFLTFTNDLSTPIFLNKFSYVKGKCPDTFIFPNSVIGALRKKNWKRINSIPDDAFANRQTFPNSLVKDAGYFSWRYSNYPGKKIHIIEVEKKGEICGFAVMKTDQKKGIPFLILMDIVISSNKFSRSESLSHILKASRQYCFRKGYFFLLFLSLEDLTTGFFPCIKLKERFNFLVKGRNPDDTKMLASTRFNLFFSDMDIV
jgi:hypothetical protein